VAARIEFARQAFAHLERIFEFVAAHSPQLALSVTQKIRSAIEILEVHPLIGRRVEDGLRELVISQGKGGYVALYRFVEDEAVVWVLGIRHQRDVGYAGE
jgi:plasmid stabilization system protein ParE